jgi:hypothetical protein
MAPIQSANTNTNRSLRRHDPLRADAAFADAFDKAQQDHLGHESDVNVEDELPPSDNEFPTYPALYTDHDNHNGTAHLRDDDDDVMVGPTFIFGRAGVERDHVNKSIQEVRFKNINEWLEGEKLKISI